MTKTTVVGTTTDGTTPIRAVVIVAYLHASIGDEKVKEAQRLMVDGLVEDGPDWVDDAVQMLVSTILPLDSSESVEWFIDDLDDLDDDEMWDLDDLRDRHKHGSTPR